MIREHIRKMSEVPHHAGSAGSRAVAEYAVEQLKSFGLNAVIEEFEALLPYPKARRVELIEPKSHIAALQEPRISEDKDSGDEGQLPTYNAYSGDGDVTAPLVYVNYGMADDYATLKQQGIDVKGKIVIARYGGGWRGLKPKLAAENGALGCIIYSDPREDGYFPGDVYPKGAFRPRDGVQRGSVMDMPLYPGDPLSPGWASEKGSRRLTREEAKTIMRVPVLPISYADAIPLLESLEGPVAPERWRGALPLTYHLGPGPAKVRLQVESEWETRPVYNVIARVEGSEFPDQWVMYGNHHDAWVNGAADPVSGAAVVLESARAIGELLKQGWKPRRTLIFALWDAEEFGLIGSTEWAEKHAEELKAKGVVYLNTGMNGKGKLGVGGSHTLEEFVTEALADGETPSGGKNLIEASERTAGPDGKPLPFRVSAAGAGSDYTAFLHHLGVASLNLGFSEGESRGIYHSIYDSFDWYDKFSDKDYTHGRALTQLMSVLMIRLVDAPLVPFEFGRFGRTVNDYVDQLAKLKNASNLKLDGLRRELEALAKESRAFESRYRQALARAAGSTGIAKANVAIYQIERAMTRASGLPGREWMKNHIYAPGLQTGYSAKTLPGVREAAEAQQWEIANQQASVLVDVLRSVREAIRHAERLLASI
jgi:N-acetylated-alpha-linked acidic dipeptidase